MGALTARALANKDIDLRLSLGYHLSGNHYPPIPQVMIEPCIEAIEAGNERDWDRLIDLPFDGVHKDTGEPFQIYWRGQDKVPAHELIKHAHLHYYLEDNDNE